MMDIASVIFGIILTMVISFIACWIIISLQDKKQLVIDDPTNDPDYHKLQETPHCPDCGNYELILEDTCDGVPWLKGKVGVDYYKCPKCGRVFNDETWKDAKHYDDIPSSED